jgi:tRNA (adenine37-N6)-methyltransferase
VREALLFRECVRDIDTCWGDPEAAGLIIDSIITDATESAVKEINGLGHTLKKWRNAILAWHTTGASNGPTEALNSIMKRIRRIATGFKRFDHYRTRLLLATGGCNWQLLGHTPRYNPKSQIVLDDRFDADALRGLEAFSHVEVVFVFDQVDEAKITVDARHPRGRTDWPRVGIFAQRAKGRPNRIGITTCEIVGVDNRVLTVRGLDAIDRTPVLDLKPCMVEFAPRTPVSQPPWSHELMRDYWS